MKNLFKIVLLVGLFISFSSSDVYSQTITNNTDCPFSITVYYSAPDCDADAVIVPANSTVFVQHKINAASGYPLQLSFGPPCPFRVSNGECGPLLPSSYPATCGLGATCGSYVATLDFGTGNLELN